MSWICYVIYGDWDYEFYRKKEKNKTSKTEITFSNHEKNTAFKKNAYLIGSICVILIGDYDWFI